MTSSVKDLPVVCIQGLGFVGAAMAVAVASARDENGQPCYQAVGVDLPTPEGRRRIAAVQNGEFPFATTDTRLVEATRAARARGNLDATDDVDVYGRASIALVDVHLDVKMGSLGPEVSLEGFRAAIRTLGDRLPAGALVIIETTVPPGSCAKLVAPELAASLEKRGLPGAAILLAHSYERVMPGPDYLDSITRFWRVYSGHTQEAADACQHFLERVIETRKFPLRRLSSTTASETAKVLENAYRATNIAFIEEWGRFAERAGIDLFEVIDAIRVRPTHSNIRQPGLGVGGYCLTKDPWFGPFAASQFFDSAELGFPFSSLAVQTNNAMPERAVDRLEALLGGLNGKRVLLMGVAYRSEVGDTRYSAAERFARTVLARGGILTCHDPFVRHWDELDLDLPEKLPEPGAFDAVVLAVEHGEYRRMDFPAWLGTSTCALLDANGVLPGALLRELALAGRRVGAVGIGGLK
jgi:UDP-N-acetyl-D-glucosamine dehydrogenase